MFNIKKRKKRTLANTFRNEFLRSVKSDILDEREPNFIDNSLEGIPLLPDGKTNFSISNELLYKLPLHLRRYSFWSIIDLVKYFEEPPEELENEPDSPDTPLSRVSRESERPLDVFKLTKDRKDSLRAIALGELRKQLEEKGSD